MKQLNNVGKSANVVMAIDPKENLSRFLRSNKSYKLIV